jgi:hypothetical protein
LPGCVAVSPYRRSLSGVHRRPYDEETRSDPIEDHRPTGSRCHDDHAEHTPPHACPPPALPSYLGLILSLTCVLATAVWATFWMSITPRSLVTPDSAIRRPAFVSLRRTFRTSPTGTFAMPKAYLTRLRAWADWSSPSLRALLDEPDRRGALTRTALRGRALRGRKTSTRLVHGAPEEVANSHVRDTRHRLEP